MNDKKMMPILQINGTDVPLEASWEEHLRGEIKKTYWAVVPKEMIPQSQTLTHYLKKNEKNNKAIIDSNI